MSYDEKILREFIRDSLNETLEWGGGGGGAAGFAGRSNVDPRGEISILKQKSYKDRWGEDRAKGWVGLLGFSESMDRAIKSLFGTKCIPARDRLFPTDCAKGLFPTIWGLVTDTGRWLLDTIATVAYPTPQSQGASEMAKRLFPQSSSILSRIMSAGSSGPAHRIGPSIVGESRSALLEGAEEDLLRAIGIDLGAIEALYLSLKSAVNLMSTMSSWEGFVPLESDWTQTLQGALSQVSKDDLGSVGEEGVKLEFVDSVVKPFLVSVLETARDAISETDLIDQPTKSAASELFNNTISNIS